MMAKKFTVLPTNRGTAVIFAGGQSLSRGAACNMTA